VSDRPSNAKKVKVPMALVEDLCQFLGSGDIHDELMEIIFKAKEPKRKRHHDTEPCPVCGDRCIPGLSRCLNHAHTLPRPRRGATQ